MNLAVKDGLVLNVDPINMADANSWGEGVTLYGVQPGDGYGWNETEFRFDGIDDFLEVYTGDITMENGFTFEIYAKNTEPSRMMTILAKTKRNSDVHAMRCYMENNKSFSASMSGYTSESDWSNNQPNNTKHWVVRENTEDFSANEGGYLTVSVDLKNNKITLYRKGKFLDSTICSKQWLEASGIKVKDIPFTIGMHVAFGPYTEIYSKMNLYSCRLYNKILSPEEIQNNYTKTVAYHEFLVEQKNK